MKDWVKTLTGYPEGEIVVIKDEHDEPSVRAYFQDAEIDLFYVSFEHDDIIRLELDGWKHLLLPLNLLEDITFLAYEAAEKWEELDTYLNEKTEEYEGWEHLITPKAAQE